MTALRVAILGIGHTGASLAHACQESVYIDSVSLYDPDASVRKRAGKLVPGAIALSLPEAVGQAEIVFLCMPVRATTAAVTELLPHVADGTILTDVGSTKGKVAHDVTACIALVKRNAQVGTVHWVPGHPVAGSEKSGPEALIPHLFRGRHCILTPLAETDAAAIATVTRVWESFGAHIEFMSPEHHDRVLAITSHLPHLIAYTIVGTAQGLDDWLHEDLTTASGNTTGAATPDPTSGSPPGKESLMRYAAGGFRDFTRIAGSDPVMWRDVFLTNREAMLDVLGRFQEDLLLLQRAVREGRGDFLENWFRRTRETRQRVIEMGQAGQFLPTEGQDPNAT